MIARYTIAIVALLASGSALAESLDAEAARHFVVGKPFEFACYDGSRGAGRVYDDGSVVGNVQFRGSGPVQSVWLPAGTLKVIGKTVCASLNGFEACFDLYRMDGQSFRGSVLGMEFAYCNFAHRISTSDSRRPFEPMSPDPPHNR